MSELKFSRQLTYYLVGNDVKTVTHDSLGKKTSIYPCSLQDAVDDFGFHSFIQPDGTGFAINPHKILGTSSILFERIEGGWRVDTPELQKKPPEDGFHAKIWDFDVYQRHAAVIFENGLILFTPFAFSQLHRLERESIYTREERIMGFEPQHLELNL